MTGIRDRQQAVDEFFLSDWFRDLPPSCQEAARKYPPLQFYKMTTTDQIVTLASYSESEDGTCTKCMVDVRSGFISTHGARVFGVSLSDLQPVDDEEAQAEIDTSESLLAAIGEAIYVDLE